MSVLWLCKEHKDVYETWVAEKQNKTASLDAINAGVKVFRAAWNKKTFLDEVKEDVEEFGFGNIEADQLVKHQ